VTSAGGVHNVGHNVQFHGPVAGRDMVIGAAPAGPSRAGPADAGAIVADVGILTILDEEMRAVTAALRTMHDYRERRLRHGPLAREAWLPARGGQPVRVAAVQTLTRGTESAAVAYRELVEEYNPSTVLLVGIAGGVHPKVRVGDVVLSDEVISYDARREDPDGVHRRGQAQAVAAELGHRLNDFGTATPAEQQAPGGETFRIHRGPIGSGNAVVTDAGSEIRRWLTDFHEKVLAVETEAAGVAQSFHESTQRDGGPRGWLTVRGISDVADQHKGYDHHELAARRAAEVMAMLVPFLHFERLGSN
jgi:adenosylhomocysteine nucleosidase